MEQWIYTTYENIPYYQTVEWLFSKVMYFIDKNKIHLNCAEDEFLHLFMQFLYNNSSNHAIEHNSYEMYCIMSQEPEYDDFLTKFTQDLDDLIYELEVYCNSIGIPILNNKDTISIDFFDLILSSVSLPKIVTDQEDTDEFINPNDYDAY